MRVLVAGDFAHAIYEPDFCDGLRSAGADVRELPILPLLGPTAVLRRIQAKCLTGPGIALANFALVAAAARHQPDVIVAWRASWLRPAAISAARKASGAKVVLYNNDDPFGPDRDQRRWRLFRRTIPAADACFAYRRKNMQEFQQAGARRVFLLRSWYRRDRHYRRELTPAERERFDCDVVFIGHCEPDARLDLMDALLASELRVKVFGTDWGRHGRGRRWSKLVVVPLYGDEYVKALSAAKIAVVFLSGRNRDEYTRRCFEIPAVGALMLAPRTPELQELFEEGREAVYFAGAGELVERARFYARSEAARESIVQAATRRLERDGHDVIARARHFLRDVASIA